MFADAYSDHVDGGAFKNLMEQLENKAQSSIVFPTCEMQSFETFVDSLLSQLQLEFQNTHIKYLPNGPSKTSKAENLNGAILTVSTGNIDSSSSSVKDPTGADSMLIDITSPSLDKSTLYIVKFQNSETMEQNKENDLWMKEVIDKAEKVTHGDFVAIWTTNSFEVPENPSSMQRPPPLRVSLSLNEMLQAGVNVSPPLCCEIDWNLTNVSQTNTIGVLYIESYGIQGLLTGFILLIIFVITFNFINNIGLSPHIADDTFSVDEIKKNQ